jgi:hypothetical protein
MSTLRSCPGGEALVSLLYDDFEPGATPSRDALTAHVRDCATCTAELEALGGVRMQLPAWTAPDVPLGFEIVRTGATPLTGWRRTFADWSARSARFVPAAAAAIVIVGGALALARLDVRYDDGGFTVRTGWGHAASAAPAPSGDDAAASLRRELAALRADVARLNARGPAVTAASIAPATADEATPVAVTAGNAPLGSTAFSSAQGDALLRRFKQALDESEMRQQQNLQLRINEVTRDFELQRRQDLVQVEQGFGRMDTQRQQMLDAIRRVSLGQVPQQ